MLSVTYPDGTVVEATDEASQAQLLAQLEARQVYSVATLAKRLGMSQRRTYDLLRNGEIAYACAGAKNYRIGEEAVRHFLRGLLPQAA